MNGLFLKKQDYEMRRGHEARRVTELGDRRDGVFEVLRTATGDGLRSCPDLKDDSGMF